MARPVWSGTISFGLVNVPVKAHTAVRDHDVHFHQLQKKTLRIRYQKVAEKSGKEVEGDDIEMGFEVAKGRYVTFDKDEARRARPESTRTIDVSDFVALEDIDPIYFERTYWLVDGDQTARAYHLLLAAMEERQRGHRHRGDAEQAVPDGGPAAERGAGDVDDAVRRRGRAAQGHRGIPRKAKPEAKSLRMATQLLGAMTSDWDPAAITTRSPRSCGSASKPRTGARTSSKRRPHPNRRARWSISWPPSGQRRCSQGRKPPADEAAQERLARGPDDGGRDTSAAGGRRRSGVDQAPPRARLRLLGRAWPASRRGWVARCKSLAIPPAWRDVWICSVPNGHLQAVGTDEAGRRQYLYHPEWRRKRDRGARSHAGGGGPARVARATVAEHLALPEMPKERALATAFRLLDLGLFRVGGESYAEENGSYGLATIEKRHVGVRADRIEFEKYQSKYGPTPLRRDHRSAGAPVRGRVRRRRSGGPQLLAYRQGRTWHDVTCVTSTSTSRT